MATPRSSSSNNISNPKHVFPNCLSKFRCNYIQCVKSNKNIIGGILLLFVNEEETIICTNDGIVIITIGCVGYGKGSTVGYIDDALLLDK